MSQVDVWGLAKKGDRGFVDYSLCPLGFCDLDWDDFSRSSEDTASASRSISKLSYDPGGVSTKGLEQRKTHLETWLSTIEESIQKLTLMRARQRTALGKLGDHIQKSMGLGDGVSSSSSSTEPMKIDNKAGDVEPSSHLDQNKLTPLSAAARLFFRHEMTKDHRQYLENKLRLFLHEKQMF